MMNLFPIH